MSDNLQCKHISQETNAEKMGKNEGRGFAGGRGRDRERKVVPHCCLVCGERRKHGNGRGMGEIRNGREEEDFCTPSVFMHATRST